MHLLLSTELIYRQYFIAFLVVQAEHHAVSRQHVLAHSKVVAALDTPGLYRGRTGHLGPLTLRTLTPAWIRDFYRAQGRQRDGRTFSARATPLKVRSQLIWFVIVTQSVDSRIL